MRFKTGRVFNRGRALPHPGLAAPRACMRPGEHGAALQQLLPSVRYFVSGGAPLTQSLLARAAGGAAVPAPPRPPPSQTLSMQSSPTTCPPCAASEAQLTSDCVCTAGSFAPPALHVVVCVRILMRYDVSEQQILMISLSA